MKFKKRLAAALLGILCTGCLAGGLTACKAKGPTTVPDNATTYRLALPKDGSAPTAHTGLENIGYMAYALDKQDSYHAYAIGTSKVMGYTQTTKTWKDYMDGVMICSDITYSTFVSAGTQACFVNNEAYMRSSSEKPSSSTSGTTAKWRTTEPTYYTKDKYLKTYGEFSTELSVYVINADTIKSCGEVVVNEDGTYSQSFSLNEEAACYYQYGMKTRGDLKGYPVFKSIDITFTFDGNWTVLSSKCLEKSKLAPNAIGGIPNDSTSNVTTTFSYGEENFDTEHYGYYESYYKQYIGKLGDGTTPPPPSNEVDVMKVLASAFGGVISGGEQFNAELTLGQTDYDGKIYLSLASLEDVLNNIDARVALGKKGSGKQDLYIDFAGGDVNAYYSDEFAMTLNIDAVSTVINQFSDWAARFKKDGAAAASYALTDEPENNPEEQAGGLDISSLLGQLKVEADDTTVTVSIETDDLMGTGIGVKLYLHCDRGDGDTYIFNNIELESISYGSDSIDLKAKITPDKDGTVISHDKAQAPADLADYASGIYSMLNCDTLKVSLNLDGGKQEVISALKGLNVTADAYVELGYDLATRVDIAIAYADLSAELAVYYGNNIDFKRYGNIYIDLLKVNGEDCNAKLYCNIDGTVDAVKQLLDIINRNTATASLTEVRSEEAANSVAAMINGILNLKFGEVLGDIYANNSQIRVSADVDMIIGALGVDVNGIKFGTAALALGLNDGKSNLSLSLAALGLSINVEGSDEQIVFPEKADYLDAVEIVEVVKAAANEANAIIDAQSIAFDIDSLVVIDGVAMRVIGKGEVDWADGLKVAVDAVMNIANGVLSDEKDEVALRLFYDQNAEEGAPFIKFAVNNLGMEIYSKDISDTQNLIQNIIDNVNLLLNGEKSGNADAETAVQLYSAAAELDGVNADEELEEIVENDNLQKILAVVLGIVKDLTISTESSVDGGSVNTLLIQHALCGNITLKADGGLSLEADITNKNGTQICNVKAGVTVGDSSTLAEVSETLDGIVTYSTEQMEYAFTKIVYNYLFAVIEDLSVENTLGSNTYEVLINLKGADSAIPALKDVNVIAKLYYTQGLEGEKVAKNKLVEIDLDLTIGTVTAKANVKYNNEKIYVSLDQIGNTRLEQVKFYAAKNDMYTAVEELVNLITDEKVIASLTGLFHPTEAAAVSAVATQADSSEISSLVSKVITFNLANVVTLRKVDGVNTATVNVDELLSLIGADLGYAIGTAKIGVNPVTHAITGGITQGGSEWATLTAQVAEQRRDFDGWQSDYIDIGFISNFIGDLTKTAFTNGELNTLYTLSGNIDIDISYASIINTSVNIKNVKVTAGLDEQNKFYLTLTGELQSSSYMFQTVAQKWNIAITYSDGYITLGREVGTTSEKFKVMTLDYLLSNLLHKENSPIRWLLGTGDTPWGLIANNVKLNLGSGLTKPQEYWLYKENIPEPDEEVKITEFRLGEILAGLKVVLGGEVRDNFGDGAGAVLAG
nr:hypothetical protein [Clostridia bacterium]